MPAFADYETAMQQVLKQVPGIRAVDEYAGDLSATQLKKVAPRDSGILLVALGGAPAGEQPDTGQLAWLARTGAFIVTRNARGSVERTRDARALAQSVMLKIRNNQWGLPGVYAAEIEKLENRSAGRADDAGYAIWLVVWKQIIYLDDLPADDSAPITHVTIQSEGHIEQEIIEGGAA